MNQSTVTSLMSMLTNSFMITNRLHYYTLTIIIKNDKTEWNIGDVFLELRCTT